MGLSRLTDAQINLQRAVELQPDFAEAHYQLGWSYQKQVQTDAAIQSFERTVALQPDFAPACNALAWYYLQQGQRLDEAMALARRAVELDPIGPYWATLAHAYHQNRKHDDAVGAIAKALELEPGHPEYLEIQRTVHNESRTESK